MGFAAHDDVKPSSHVNEEPTATSHDHLRTTLSSHYGKQGFCRAVRFGTFLHDKPPSCAFYQNARQPFVVR
jgi:hypothetical protein